MTSTTSRVSTSSVGRSRSRTLTTRCGLARASSRPPPAATARSARSRPDCWERTSAMDLNRLRYIGDRPVGPDHPVFVTAEIGINHNGSLPDALAMIDVAVQAGCDAVKFQKRTPEICVPKDQQDVERDTPWGRMTYLAYRHRVEFGRDEYAAISR